MSHVAPLSQKEMEQMIWRFRAQTPERIAKEVAQRSGFWAPRVLALVKQLRNAEKLSRAFGVEREIDWARVQRILGFRVQPAPDGAA